MLTLGTMVTCGLQLATDVDQLASFTPIEIRNLQGKRCKNWVGHDVMIS